MTKQQIDKSIDEWNEKGFKDHREYVEWYSGSTLILDGRFSIHELKELIAEIEAIQATWQETPESPKK